MVELFIAFGSGIFFGVGLTLLIYKIILKKNDKELTSAIDFATGQLKASFNEISQQTLSVTTEHMIRLASEKLHSEREISFKELSGQKNIIETRIVSLNGELDKLTALVNGIENRRNLQLGELKSVISESQARTAELSGITANLNKTLSAKQHRGQWAERMAGDILNYAGLKEGINYTRQETSTSTGNRPDFTFKLPNGMKLNMDVKFPFENYQKFVSAETDEHKNMFRKEFIKDVKIHIKAVSSREYINPDDNTIDCVLLFIPNESIYGLIFESDLSVLEEAGGRNVLICSPVTILSILAIIRQAADNFVIANRAKELLNGINIFRREWLKYSEGFEKLGTHIERLSKEYSELKTTRTNKLENSVGKLEALDDDKNVIEE